MLKVTYFSDVLCIWAYAAQVRVDELRRNFADEVSLDYRFVSIFGSTRTKIVEGWSERGGLEGYAAHVQKVAAGFDHIELHPDVWSCDVPAGSLGAHAFARAVAGLVEEGRIPNSPADDTDGRSPLEELLWRLRLAFFRDQQDIGNLDVLMEVAGEMELPLDEIRSRLRDGTALAALAEDHEAAFKSQVTGSPTFLLDNGRQRLYGNVGYRVIEANIQELLRDNSDRASWC
jgi:predicted DsbA family dithiol-disulfide isomerase